MCLASHTAHRACGHLRPYQLPSRAAYHAWGLGLGGVSEQWVMGYGLWAMGLESWTSSIIIHQPHASNTHSVQADAAGGRQPQPPAPAARRQRSDGHACATLRQIDLNKSSTIIHQSMINRRPALHPQIEHCIVSIPRANTE